MSATSMTSCETSQSPSLWRPALVLALVNVMVGASGFIRETVAAYYFGTSASADAYSIVLFFLDTVSVLVLTGAAAVLVPHVAGAGTADPSPEQREVVGSFVSIGVATFTVLAIIVGLSAPLLVRFGLPDLAGSTRDLTARLLLLTSPACPLLAAAGLRSAVLQARRDYVSPGLARILLNLTIAAVLVTATVRLGLNATALALVAAAGVQLGVVIWASHRARYPLSWTWRPSPAVRALLGASVPALLAVGFTNVLLGVGERFFLSHLGQGSIAAVNYAWRVYYILVTGGLALQVVSFTELSHQAGHSVRGEAAESLRSSIRAGFFFLLPTSIGVLLLREPLIALIYLRGQFDRGSLELTTTALTGYALALFPSYLAGLIVRALFALNMSSRAVTVAALWTVAALVLDGVLVRTVGLMAIPFGYGFGAALASLVGLLVVERRLTAPLLKPLSRYAIRIICLATVSSAPLACATMLWHAMGPNGRIAVGPMAALTAGALVSGTLFLTLTGTKGVSEIRRMSVSRGERDGSTEGTL